MDSSDEGTSRWSLYSAMFLLNSIWSDVSVFWVDQGGKKTLAGHFGVVECKERCEADSYCKAINYGVDECPENYEAVRASAGTHAVTLADVASIGTCASRCKKSSNSAPCT